MKRTAWYLTTLLWKQLKWGQCKDDTMASGLATVAYSMKLEVIVVINPVRNSIIYIKLRSNPAGIHTYFKS